MTIKVFVENESGKNEKNIYDEKSLEYKKTFEVSRKYPYPYGFILNTTSGDGDNLDVFLITHQKYKRGEIVECEVIGIMEQFEKSWDEDKNCIEERDHNILAAPIGEEGAVTDEIKRELTDFVLHVFDHIQKDKSHVGNFLGKREALQEVERSQD